MLTFFAVLAVCGWYTAVLILGSRCLRALLAGRRVHAWAFGVSAAVLLSAGVSIALTWR